MSFFSNGVGNLFDATSSTLGLFLDQNKDNRPEDRFPDCSSNIAIKFSLSELASVPHFHLVCVCVFLLLVATLL
jgi:hypothetical protein